MLIQFESYMYSWTSEFWLEEKIHDWAIQPLPPKSGGWTHVLRKGNSSCSISDIHHATFVKMPVINHKSRKEDGMVTIRQRNIIWPRYIVKVNKYSLLGPQLNCCRRMSNYIDTNVNGLFKFFDSSDVGIFQNPE